MQNKDNLARSSAVRVSEPVRAYAAMNTVRALERLAFVAMSAPELADCLGVSVRNARRLLKRLALEGFVVQERGYRRRYRATLRLAALGRQLLDRAPLAQAALPHLAGLADRTSSVAHLWIHEYDDRVVCAVHADGRAGCAIVSVLREVRPAVSTAAGCVLLADRAELRSCCYLHVSEERAFAASVLERGRVVAALGITGERALDATAAVTTAAARLSVDLGSRP